MVAQRRERIILFPALLLTMVRKLYARLAKLKLKIIAMNENVFK